jgi:hypothetical protein
VDIEYGALRKLELGDVSDAEDKSRLKQLSRTYKRINGLLTPMSKYYASEMSMRVSNDAMAVLGGSGYMKDYPVERHLRDARITTIYEGTTQLQVVAAVRGVSSGTAQNVVEMLLERPSRGAEWPAEIQPLVERIRAALNDLAEAVAFVKSQGGTEYMDLYGRKLVDMAVALIVAALFCDHATAKESKLAVARRWLAARLPELRMNKELICSGDRCAIADFEALAGPVPVAE